MTIGLDPENREEYQEDYQEQHSEDQGADPGASDVGNEEEEVPGQRFDVPERQDQLPQWKGSVAEPRVEDFGTIEEYYQAEDAYNRLPSTPFRDDEDASQRQELDNWMRHCTAEAELAKGRGDHQRARDWDQRAIMAAEDLRRLGPTEEQRFMQAADRGAVELPIDFLISPEAANAANWNDPRLQHDTSVMIDRFNRGTDGRIVIPMEDERFGKIQPAKPENLLIYDLTPDQVEGLRHMVYFSGGPTDLDSIFRATHDYLRQIGVDASGIRVAGEKPTAQRTQANQDVVGGRTVTSAPAPIRPTGGSPGVSYKDPENMSQAEYEQFRSRKSA
jgi:hypothetical protein